MRKMSSTTRYLVLLLLVALCFKTAWLGIQLYVLEDRDGYLYPSYSDEWRYHQEGVGVYEHLLSGGISLKEAVEYHHAIRWTIHWGYPVMMGYIYYFLNNSDVNNIRLLNVFFSIISVLLAYAILMELKMPNRFIFFMMLPVVVWPSINLFASTALKEPSVIALLLAAIFLFHKLFKIQFREHQGRKALQSMWVSLGLGALILLSTVFRAILPVSLILSFTFTMALVSKSSTKKAFLVVGVIFLVIFLLNISTTAGRIFDITGDVVFSRRYGVSDIARIIFQYCRFFINPLPGQAYPDFRQIGNYTFFIKVFVSSCALFFGASTLIRKNRLEDFSRATVILIFFQIMLLGFGYVVNGVAGMRQQHQVWLPLWILFTVGLFNNRRQMLFVGGAVSMFSGFILLLYLMFVS